MFEIPEDDEFWDDLPFDDNESSKDSHENVTSYNTSTFESSSKIQSASIPSTSSTSKTLTAHSVIKRPERKFPGPAGLLPSSVKLSSNNLSELTVSSSENKDNAEICTLPASQAPQNEFKVSHQWQHMLKDLGDEAHVLLSKFSIKALLLRASRKMLNKGKAPLVIGMLENLDLQGSDAGFLIRDETGKMKGSLHKDLIQDPSTALQAGCVLILRQVSVISLSARTHYLNVTPGNIVYIYTATPEVKKRTWPFPPSQEVAPSLRCIIEESERELNSSVTNFQNKLSSGSSMTFMSPRAPLSAGKGSFTRQTRPNLTSPSLFTSNSLQPPVHSSRAQTTPSPRFQPRVVKAASETRSSLSGVRFPQNHGSECSLPSGINGKLQNFRHPLPVSSTLNGKCGKAHNYMVSGQIAPRNMSTPYQLASNSIRGPSTISQDGAEFASSFDFDFPEDNADGELSQICDETLSEPDIFYQDREKSSQSSFKLDLFKECEPVAKAASSVIDNVLRDCYKENRSNFQVQEIQAQPKDGSNKSVPGKSFTFKRCNVASSTFSNTSLFSPKRMCISDQSTVPTDGAINAGNSPQDSFTHFTQGNKDTKLFDFKHSCSKAQSVGRLRDSRVQLGHTDISAAPNKPDEFAQWNDGNLLMH